MESMQHLSDLDVRYIN